MPCLRNEFGRGYKYFTTQVTGKTCSKAVGILYRGEKPRTSVLHDKYYLRIAFNEPFHTVERPFEEVEVDNTLRDLQNSSYPTKAEFNNCFIIYSKYFPVFKGGFAISLFVLSFTKYNTTLSPGFLGQWFNNLQRAALLTSFDVIGSIIFSGLHF